MKLGKGQKILIHGGAGGIGTFAIQIAKEIGAEIATTASASEFEYVKALGATTVIDYKNERFEDKVGEYDAVFDTVGGETYERSFKVLKKGGVIVSMLEKPKEELATMHGVKALMQSTEITRARLEKLSALVEKGALKIKIDKVFSSIEQASAALEYLKVGHPKGKVVVKIGK
jgi:NADPH:quinone reductase-like Zn-dependent oxidoreductase